MNHHVIAVVKNSTTWFNGPSFLLHSIGELKTTISILKNLDNFFIKKVTFVDRLLSKKIQVELFVKSLLVKSSSKFIKNDTDIAYKDSNFRIQNRLFIICVGKTVGGHPPAKKLRKVSKIKKRQIEKVQEFQFFHNSAWF